MHSPGPLTPADVVTVTFTLPTVSAGEVAVIDPLEFTVKLVALTDPKSTAATSIKLFPLMFTVVPPAAGPLCIERPLMMGVSSR